MPEERSTAGWIALGSAGLGGSALALARFIHYVQTVDEVDVSFAEALGWWGAWLAGAGLLAAGVMTLMDEEEPSAATWAPLLVGLLILVLMPAFPAFTFNFDLGGMFGP